MCWLQVGSRRSGCESFAELGSTGVMHRVCLVRAFEFHDRFEGRSCCSLFKRTTDFFRICPHVWIRSCRRQKQWQELYLLVGAFLRRASSFAVRVCGMFFFAAGAGSGGAFVVAGAPLPWGRAWAGRGVLGPGSHLNMLLWLRATFCLCCLLGACCFLLRVRGEFTHSLAARRLGASRANTNSEKRPQRKNTCTGLDAFYVGSSLTHLLPS